MTADTLRRVDPQGMFDAVRDFHRQIADGRAQATGLAVDFSVDDATQVVVLGMGGSAIGGDLLRALAAPVAPVPVQVVRGYTLPASVDQRAIVIASSYSGNTEETLSALDEAVARRCRVICIASGGAVERIAHERGFPFVKVTGGLQPRAALGYSLTALLAVADAIGLLHVPDAAWEEALGLLREQSAQYANLDENEARRLAESLRGRFPLIYTGNGLLEPVGVRWRGQLQENAKVLAASNVFPELNHNEIMGWDQPSDLFERLAVVVLHDRDDHARVQRRMAVTRELLEAKPALWHEVEAEGEYPLTRMLSTIHFGDWVSLYLALLRDVDPTPVNLIEDLKRTLAG